MKPIYKLISLFILAQIVINISLEVDSDSIPRKRMPKMTRRNNFVKQGKIKGPLIENDKDEQTNKTDKTCCEEVKKEIQLLKQQQQNNNVNNNQAQNNQNSKTPEPDNAFDMLYKLQNLLKEEIVIKERCMIFHIKKYVLFS